MSNIGSNGSARSVAATHGSARSVAATHGSARSVAATNGSARSVATTHGSDRSVEENSAVKYKERNNSFIQLLFKNGAAFVKQLSSTSGGNKEAKVSLEQLNIKVVRDEYDPKNPGIIKVALPSVRLPSAKEDTPSSDNASIRIELNDIKHIKEEQEFNSFFLQADKDDSFLEYTEEDNEFDLDQNYNDNSTETETTVENNYDISSAKAETTVENNYDISSTKADAGSVL